MIPAAPKFNAPHANVRLALTSATPVEMVPPRFPQP